MAFANFDPIEFQEKGEQLSASFKDRPKLTDVDFKFENNEIAMHPEKMPKKFKISTKNGELILVFEGSILYKNGQWKPDAENLRSLDAMIEIIRINNPHARVLIEGHADDINIDKESSNWILSSARAAFIAERFAFFGIAPKNVSAIAKADNDKLQESISKDGKFSENIAMMNRRAIIKVLEPSKKQKIKLGLGVYFKVATEDNPDNATDSMDKFDVVAPKK
jgi:flagellar motor protein MotB